MYIGRVMWITNNTEQLKTIIDLIIGLGIETFYHSRTREPVGKWLANKLLGYVT